MATLTEAEISRMTEDEAWNKEGELGQIDAVRQLLYNLPPKYAEERKALRNHWAKLYADRLGITPES